MEQRTVGLILEVIRNIFCIPVARKCLHTATACLVRVERGHCVRLRLYWYNDHFESLTRTHLLLAGNDTVPISVWRGEGMRSTECCLVTYYYCSDC